MDAFDFGPFTFDPGQRVMLAGDPAQVWAMNYSGAHVSTLTIPAPGTRDDVVSAFADGRASFAAAARASNKPDCVALIDFETGNEVGRFLTPDSCGMTPGMIDDRSRYWIRSADRLRSRPVTLSEFAGIAASVSALPCAWIAGLLPDDVLTNDPAEWRAPTSWEVRHVVGEGSFTGISGAKAATLVGVTPQNFRKYTARDGASTRQNMSFAMWHLLLHKLGVKRA